MKRTAHRRARRRPRLSVEVLESRWLPSGLPWGSLLPEDEGNDTIDLARPLDERLADGAVTVTGHVGDSPAGAADVDFYRFTLAQPGPSRVRAALASPDGGASAGVFSLYNEDPEEPTGHRLVFQVQGTAGGAEVAFDRVLPAGTYYVAVSGAGNDLFHPRLADSGLGGQTGDYLLGLALGEPEGLPSGLSVLTAEPAAGSWLASSPAVLRVAFSGAVDPGSIQPDWTVSLISSANETFGDGDDLAVPLGEARFNEATSELLVRPAAPLLPGRYRLSLAGDPVAHPDTLRAPDGTPLGRDHSFDFAVAGIEGGSGSDDLVETAHDLGDVVGVVVRASGVIGDDASDPTPYNPSDVDLYHFRLEGEGKYAFAAEVFAGRIGSPLDPALTLFRADPAGQLVLLASNGNTSNGTKSADGGVPLLTDSALFASLPTGDYYLAVSSGFNYVDPEGGLFAGTDGVFEPGVSHTGEAGNSTGRYVLAVKAEPAGAPPRVVSTSLDDATLAAAPTRLVVRFDAPVNLQQLAHTAYVRSGVSRVSSVFVRSDAGEVYHPRLESYDPATNTATFLMIDRLGAGAWGLHLSGPLGLTDLSGNPLAGNDPGGDHVARFHVAEAGEGGDRTFAGPSSQEEPHRLGVLFPAEVEAKVAVVWGPGEGGESEGGLDHFQFELIQEQDYLFVVTPASGAPPVVTLWDGEVQLATLDAGEGAVFAHLLPGTYTLRIDRSALGASAEGYQVDLSMLGSPEPAPPLTSGPAPVLRLRLAADAPPVPASPAPTGGQGTDVSREGGSRAIDVARTLAAAPLGEASPAPAPPATLALRLDASPSFLLPIVALQTPASGGGAEPSLTLGQALALMQNLPAEVDLSVAIATAAFPTGDEAQAEPTATPAKGDSGDRTVGGGRQEAPRPEETQPGVPDHSVSPPDLAKAEGGAARPGDGTTDSAVTHEQERGDEQGVTEKAALATNLVWWGLAASLALGLVGRGGWGVWRRLPRPALRGAGGAGSRAEELTTVFPDAGGIRP